jgi:hypothetical protein
MRSCTLRWLPDHGWHSRGTRLSGFRADLLLVFGDGRRLAESDALPSLERAHPNAVIASVSTAGEIVDQSVLEGSVVALAMEFASTQVRAVRETIGVDESSDVIAERLASRLSPADLAHVFLFSDGLHVNGSTLAQGLAARLPKGVALTGGLAGDGDRFVRTCVGLGSSVAERDVVAIGLYGRALHVGYGSVGGWDAFGPERLITRAHGNVLRSLDGEPALALYKRYLGPAAAGLPASALLFPLALLRGDGSPPLVRTVLAVNDNDDSMTFAGDVPEGASVRLMRANFDRLVDGAELAALEAHSRLGRGASAAVLVSCVGRRLVLKQRVEDEIDGVRSVLGPETSIAGFYSYGEISPVADAAGCELHNQTMTITTLVEW